jgi:L-cysteine S-thiosulfotransferase
LNTTAISPMQWRMRSLWLAAALAPLPAAAAQGATAFVVVGDAIPAPLTATPGDATRGRAVVGSRQTGLCLLCHAGPFPDVPQQGNLAPDLAGAGSRWSAGQLRLRLVDPRRVDPQTIMPAYFRTDGWQRPAAAMRERPLLDAQQIEDAVAFLQTLKAGPP